MTCNILHQTHRQTGRGHQGELGNDTQTYRHTLLHFSMTTLIRQLAHSCENKNSRDANSEELVENKKCNG